MLKHKTQMIVQEAIVDVVVFVVTVGTVSAWFCWMLCQHVSL